MLALICVIFGMTYYILTSGVKKLAKEIPVQNKNIAMAQPHSMPIL